MPTPCPRCKDEAFKPAAELDADEQAALKKLTGRDLQGWEHRLQNHYVCTSCWLEVHG